jgi:hypothetical protein
MTDIGQTGNVQMNHIERFNRVMAFEPVDRLPAIEWAGYWDQTLARWQTEGLPAEWGGDAAKIREGLGLDPYRQFWIGPWGSDPGQELTAKHIPVRSAADYEALLPLFYPNPPFNAEWLKPVAEKNRAGEIVVWLSLTGFFWWPRTLFGIEGHLLAFYDHPELMHRMNEDLLAFNLRAIEAACKIVRPSFMTIAEDMSYNHGPMLSKECFDEFLAPYYRRLIPVLKEHGILPLVDTDGMVEPMIPWLEEVGIEGCLPLERMAGVDVARIRKNHPRWRMIGAFDKTVMHRGEAAVRAEFERLRPVMQSGGFIPSVDHQTPPAVGLEQYKRYVAVLGEYVGLDR